MSRHFSITGLLVIPSLASMAFTTAFRQTVADSKKWASVPQVCMYPKPWTMANPNAAFVSASDSSKALAQLAVAP